MKKQLYSIISIIGLSVMLTACSGGENQTENTAVSQEESGENQQGQHKILVAYFTRLDNTDADVDLVIQGGGPYGEIGDSLEDADLDAIASASITIRDDAAHGNTQTVAEMIQEETSGDLFSIQAEDAYPVDYGALIDAGEEENAENSRPNLTSHVENMDEYDVVFLGFPNWWYDMPMPVYSFLEEYDFTGKTVIPFATSAGSGFSDTISSIKNALPESNVEENGLHIQMNEIEDAQPEVEKWLKELEIVK